MRTKCLDRMLCALLIGLAGSASAETEDFFDLSPDDLSKLKVTAASAFAESALDSSATVSVVQREDWEDRGARTLPDAAMHLPGVMLLQPPAGGKLIQVRSYDSASQRGRAVLVDGVPINTFAFGSEVYSNAELQLPILDHFELVRGPSSILYGSDAFHSALLLSTYRSPVPEFEITGSAGSADYQQAAVRGTHLLSDKQVLTAAVSATHQGDQEQNYPYRTAAGVITDTQRETSYDAGSALLRWDGKAGAVGHSLTLFVDKTDASEFLGGGSAFGDTRNFDVADHNAELWMVKGQLDGEIASGWNWRWDAYYWQNDYGQSFALPANPPTATVFYEDRQQFVEHRQGTTLRLTQPSLKALGGLTQVALTAGYEEAGIDEHDNNRRLLGGGPIAQPTLDYSGMDQTIASASLEAKTRWADDRWQLVYGGRIDDYTSFGSQISPRLGLIWIPATNYSIKALYGEAFRAPNANELEGTNFVSGDSRLSPETLNNFELVFAMASGPWLLELVGFDSQWRDRIILQPDPTARNGRRYANVGESESKGLELSLNYRANNWRVEASASSISNRNVATGGESGIFPEWMLNLGGGYRWQGPKLEFFVSNHAHQDIKVGDQGLSAVELDDAGIFFRTDVSLQQEWTPALKGRVVVRNVFDRDNTWPALLNNRGGFADIGRQVVFELDYRIK